MLGLIALYLVICSIVIIWIILVQASRGTVELASLRNIFLAGYIMFQLSSATTSLLFEEYNQLYVQYPVYTGLVFSFLSTIFLVFFFFSYKSGWVVKRLGKKQLKTVQISPLVLILLALSFCFFGLFLRFVVGQVPVLGVLSVQLAVGVFAAACGLVGWAWAPRPLNVPVALAGFGVVCLTLFVLLLESFGRRELLTCLLAFGFAAYWSAWRYLGYKRLISRLALVGIPVVLFMAVFTAARTGSERERTITQTVSAMASVNFDDLKLAVVELMSGQLAGGNSLWLVENYPTSYPYVQLHSVVYYFTQPIPRVYWEGKPDAVGRIMVQQGQFQRVGANYSLGPGLVGHIAHDNPWIAVWLYGIALALLFRWCDDLTRANAMNPILIVTMGAGLSQILGLARGELGLFLFNATTSMVGAWIAGWVTVTFFASIGWMNRTEPLPLASMESTS